MGPSLTVAAAGLRSTTAWRAQSDESLMPTAGVPTGWPCCLRAEALAPLLCNVASAVLGSWLPAALTAVQADRNFVQQLRRPLGPRVQG